MSKKKTHKAKQAAESALAVRRAGMAALLCFGGLMLIGLIGGFFMLRGRGHQHVRGRVAHEEETLIDLANARCPTCWDAVAADLTLDWRHVRVRLARPECRGALLSAPEKVLDASGIDWRGAARAAREINHLTGKAREQALSKAEGRWHVVPPGEHDERNKEGD